MNVNEWRLTTYCPPVILDEDAAAHGIGEITAPRHLRHVDTWPVTLAVDDIGHAVTLTVPDAEYHTRDLSDAGKGAARHYLRNVVHTAADLALSGVDYAHHWYRVDAETDITWWHRPTPRNPPIRGIQHRMNVRGSLPYLTYHWQALHLIESITTVRLHATADALTSVAIGVYSDTVNVEALTDRITPHLTWLIERVTRLVEGAQTGPIR